MSWNNTAKFAEELQKKLIEKNKFITTSDICEIVYEYERWLKESREAALEEMASLTESEYHEC